MSLSQFRESINKRLGEEADKLANEVIDMRVHPEFRADSYALVQVDKLAQARAFAKAAQIITQEYKRLTESPSEQAAPNTPTTKREATYG